MFGIIIQINKFQRFKKCHFVIKYCEVACGLQKKQREIECNTDNSELKPNANWEENKTFSDDNSSLHADETNENVSLGKFRHLI